MLSLVEIDKSFGATHAVRAVTLEAAPGTVLGLVGENGAGKSTLIKMVSGAIAPDAGEMRLDGRPVAPRSIHDALPLGIASVFQELTLVRSLSVAENLFLGAAPLTPWGSIDRRRLRAQARDTLERHGLDLDPSAPLGSLPLGSQQMLEIVRALARRPRVLLLDEATSALGATEVDWLANHVRALAGQGAVVLFISHRWDEVTHFTNRVAVLRNGELMAVADTADLSEREAVRLMTGVAGPGEAFPPKPVLHPSAPAAVARGLRSKALEGVDLSVTPGEILGLGGLVGQGQGPVLEAFFGAHRLAAGTVEIGGEVLVRPSPRRAIRAGAAYVPQERKTEGLLLGKSVGQNLTLAALDRLPTRLALIASGAETALVEGAIVRAQVKTTGPDEAIRNLSGGNQQKVLLEKWLLTRPRLLLLNDVTRGVDVGTKRQIYRTIADIAATGVAVIWYSTDARELVGVAHRVLVMLGGRVSAELRGDDLTADRIVHAAVFGPQGAAA